MCMCMCMCACVYSMYVCVLSAGGISKTNQLGREGTVESLCASALVGIDGNVGIF